MASNAVSNIKIIAQNQHTEAMTMLFDSGEDSDFTVKCGNRVWQLHRVILRSGSEYFKNACSKKFEEGTSGIVDLKEEDPQYAGILLRYFYALDYQIDDNGKPPLVAHALVYAIADKYGVGQLKDLAKEKFAMAITTTRVTDIPSFIAAIEVVYTSTLGSDRGLRACLLPKLKEYKQQLRDSDEFMALILSGFGEGEFAVDVIDAWAGLCRMRRS
ncbi:hypothetical protein HO133_006052 [Letharia lupina]|uniref:BTB domain-containing protein n=1 Tax=Letharia lupina TaxID=560253 RepID=A0A8H6C8M2_9LECA|nr:uncharacterized protein HO133_006052 [Letharia lupina]KAF6218701.1 hypothetical protein HO133_006052 [Letharia lupina]